MTAEVAKVYPNVEAAKAEADPTSKSIRPYEMRLGEHYGVVLSRNADLAKSVFFSHIGGSCETFTAKKTTKVSVASLQRDLEVIRNLRSQMNGKTKDAVEQQNFLDKRIEELVAQIESAKALKSGGSPAAPAAPTVPPAPVPSPEPVPAPAAIPEPVAAAPAPVAVPAPAPAPVAVPAPAPAPAPAPVAVAAPAPVPMPAPAPAPAPAPMPVPMPPVLPQ